MDAEQQRTKKEAVKKWLNELSDLAYDAEDTLAEFEIYVEQYQVRRSIPHELKDQINFEIKKINERLEKLKNRMIVLGLERIHVEGRMSDEITKRTPTTSILDESCFYGRETDKNNIIFKLLSWDGPSDERNYGVLPIVGMGGLGKTTLAQSVYHDDERVEKHFKLRAWVCVSEEIDNAKITKAIIESATMETCSLTSLEALQGKLKKMLSGEKFLIVLDDVWNEKLEDWEELQKPFQFGEKGSRVMVTTRTERVSLNKGTLPAYHLGGLEDKYCWSLLKQRAAVDDALSNANPNLEAIGRKIVERCKGVPLAVKTLGGLLRFKVEEKDWEYVLKSEMWELKNESEGIMPALRLSFQHLPAHLKRCFAYCSIFPKDYVFDKEQLVLYWMGEGFIVGSKGGTKQMEDIGSEYFDELCFRSFFQYSGNNKSFVMHDRIHDLAQSISKNICFRVDEDDKWLRNNRNINIPNKARHLSLFATKPIDDNALDHLVKNKCSSPRTSLLLGKAIITCQVAKLGNLYDTWRYLRVLSLLNVN
nr:TPA_asm: hypothetical protein HUJ06_003533 [Nelumbo nucifera]